MAGRVLRTQLMGVACCRALQTWPCCVRPKFQELCSSNCQGTALNRAACSSRAENLSYCLVFGTGPSVRKRSAHTCDFWLRAGGASPLWRLIAHPRPAQIAQRLLKRSRRGGTGCSCSALRGAVLPPGSCFCCCCRRLPQQQTATWLAPRPGSAALVDPVHKAHSIQGVGLAVGQEKASASC